MSITTTLSLRLHQTGFTLGLDIEELQLGPTKLTVPWIDPYKLVCRLSELDKLDCLHGNNSLTEFWRRYAKEEPGHFAFEEARENRLNLAKTIPFYSHGDEGRGKRKRSVLIWSLRGCVGKGTEHFKSRHSESAQAQRMGLNFAGSLTSRFVHVAIPKNVYGKNSEPIWDDLARNIAGSYRKLQVAGFDHFGERYHAVCIGLTGDNPFLAKVGHLERSFARAPKKAIDTGAVHGICWMCLAGTATVPYENLNTNPEWIHTVGERLPWSTLPPFLKGLGMDDTHNDMAPRMLLFDIWHNFHGGIGKHMVSSTVAEIIPHMEPPSIDKKLELINESYNFWRKESKLKLHAGILDKELFGLEGGLQAVPTGAWSMFNDTRVLMSFLEWFLEQRRLYIPNNISEEALVGIRYANHAFRVLYNSGYWLTAEECKDAGSAGMKFLQSYARLAAVTLKESRLRYPLMPKIHYCHHSFRDLMTSDLAWTRSPLAGSVQLDEDNVGRVARLHRRCGTHKIMLRTLQRWQVAASLALFPEKRCRHHEHLFRFGRPPQFIRSMVLAGFWDDSAGPFWDATFRPINPSSDQSGAFDIHLHANQ